MSKLETYARYKEKEFKNYVDSAKRVFERGDMGLDGLERAMKKAFDCGHNAGHCRGENYASRNVKKLYPVGGGESSEIQTMKEKQIEAELKGDPIEAARIAMKIIERKNGVERQA